ncbi:TetR/AcrR family transcriptional regulator [Microlunatus parietis]|uniref:AcrR family transcriptional regulator n=1 Tax=Microlunatus parietis TaxID=682979 RepID=A0A7Y9I7Q5_9ACTN|nr:TetR/AcrR family transcriptional regulator [Microlunatus parietis]NYE71648.1 AcrR family transcriptional regulator [Microlunatus parietis]
MQLLAEAEVGGLSMAEVAEAAGVGVGTVYRRFGDRAGLLLAVMNHREAELQSAIRVGEPPLGPGAPPADRAVAFLHAYADILEDFGEVMAAAEAKMSGPRRFRTGPYLAHWTHLRDLAQAADHGLDADYLADTLLAPLAAAIFVQQRRADGYDLDRIKAGLRTLAIRLLG